MDTLFISSVSVPSVETRNQLMAMGYPINIIRLDTNQIRQAYKNGKFYSITSVPTLVVSNGQSYIPIVGRDQILSFVYAKMAKKPIAGTPYGGGMTAKPVEEDEPDHSNSSLKWETAKGKPESEEMQEPLKPGGGRKKKKKAKPLPPPEEETMNVEELIEAPPPKISSKKKSKTPVEAPEDDLDIPTFKGKRPKPLPPLIGNTKKESKKIDVRKLMSEGTKTMKGYYHKFEGDEEQ